MKKFLKINKRYTILSEYLLFCVTSCMGLKKQGFWPKINCSQTKSPNFGSSSGDGTSKIGHDFSNKRVLKLKLQKKVFTKNVPLNNNSSLKKKFRQNRMIFDIENSL